MSSPPEELVSLVKEYTTQLLSEETFVKERHEIDELHNEFERQYEQLTRVFYEQARMRRDEERRKEEEQRQEREEAERREREEAERREREEAERREAVPDESA